MRYDEWKLDSGRENDDDEQDRREAFAADLEAEYLLDRDADGDDDEA